MVIIKKVTFAFKLLFTGLGLRSRRTDNRDIKELNRCHAVRRTCSFNNQYIFDILNQARFVVVVV